MSAISRAVGTILMASVVVFGSGCAFVRGSAAGSAFVADGMRHLRLPGADEPRHKAVAYRSPFGYEEYGRSQVNGRAEALFLRTQGIGTALDVSARRLESLTAQWAYNRHGSPLEWAQWNRSVPGSSITYRLYRHRESGGTPSRQCVAFIRTWAVKALDPLLRPTRAYFGYWCLPAGQALTVDAAERYLRRIEIASPPLLGFHLGQLVPHDAAAGPQASGATDPDWGITPFPFNRFRHYAIGSSHSTGH